MPLLLVASLFSLAAQQSSPAPLLSGTMDARRVHDDRYRLVMFRTNADTASGFLLVERTVEHTQLNGRKAIRVRESNRAAGSEVSLYLDAASLRPLSWASASSDTLSVTATVDGDTLRTTEVRRGVTTTSATPAGRDVYLSSSFSELLQANDFGAHPRIAFSTLTPGGPVSRFQVERMGTRAFEHGVEVWVLRFTRTDAAGVASPAGFRYVDIRTGKVLFFATELDSPSVFSYQVLPLR